MNKKVADIIYVKIVGKVKSFFFFHTKIKRTICDVCDKYTETFHSTLSEWEHWNSYFSFLNKPSKKGGEKNKNHQMTHHHQSFVPSSPLPQSLKPSHHIKDVRHRNLLFPRRCPFLCLLDPTFLEFCCTKQTQISSRCERSFFQTTFLSLKKKKTKEH